MLVNLFTHLVVYSTDSIRKLFSIASSALYYLMIENAHMNQLISSQVLSPSTLNYVQYEGISDHATSFNEGGDATIKIELCDEMASFGSLKYAQYFFVHDRMVG